MPCTMHLKLTKFSSFKRHLKFINDIRSTLIKQRGILILYLVCRGDTKAFSNLLHKVCHTPEDSDSAHATPSAWETFHLQAFPCHTNRKGNVTLTSENRFLSRKQGWSQHQEGIKQRKWMNICNWCPLAKYLIHSRPGNPNGHARLPLWLLGSAQRKHLCRDYLNPWFPYALNCMCSCQFQLKKNWMRWRWSEVWNSLLRRD